MGCIAKVPQAKVTFKALSKKLQSKRTLRDRITKIADT